MGVPIGDTSKTNKMFLSAWENAARRAPAKTTESEREKAMALFRKAMSDCDKATERMMDKHHESVAKSAQKRAAYLKEKARRDAIADAALEQRLINEAVLIRRINHSNRIEEDRVNELNRKALLEMEK